MKQDTELLYTCKAVGLRPGHTLENSTYPITKQTPNPLEYNAMVYSCGKIYCSSALCIETKEICLFTQ